MTIKLRSNLRLEIELGAETAIERAYIETMLEAASKGAAVHLEPVEKAEEASTMILCMARQ